MRKTLWIIALVLIAAVTAPNARADSFTFTVTGGISGSGTLTTDPLSGGTYLITGITGTFGGSAITGIIAPGGGVPFVSGNDNLLYPTAPYFDGLGVSFTTATNLSWELWTFNVGGITVALDSNGNHYDPLTLVITGVTPQNPNPNPTVPEPSAAYLIGAGLLGLLAVGRNKFVRLNGLAQ